MATSTSTTGAARRGLSASAAVDHALIVLPLIVTVLYLLAGWAAHNTALDFHTSYWVAGHRVLDGIGPYGWSRHDLLVRVSFPYPAVAAVLFAPWALIPRALADLLFTGVCIGAGFAALRLLGIRDRRVYGLVFLWSPIVDGWHTANLTLLLVLGIALAWRYRDRPIILAVVVAVCVSVKPVVWPLAIWMLATRRYRASAYAVVVGIGLNAAAWGVIGYGEIGRWLHLMSLQMDTLYRDGYGVVALGAHLGVSRGLCTVVELAVTGVVIIGCVAAGRRGDDRRALALGVFSMLTAAPVVDDHYIAFLIVPIALAQPRLGWAWIAPLVLWACPASQVQAWQEVVSWLVAIGLVYAAYQPARGSDSVTRATDQRLACGTGTSGVRAAIWASIRNASGRRSPGWASTENSS